MSPQPEQNCWQLRREFLRHITRNIAGYGKSVMRSGGRSAALVFKLAGNFGLLAFGCWQAS